jgi:hypothetical protein
MRSPRTHRGARSLLLSILLCLTLGGCGYSSGYRLPDGVGSLAVPIFRNETFPLRRDVEIDLTREVKEELRLRSDARVVADAYQADAVLEGVILEFQEGVLTEGALDQVQESGIVIRVRIRLVRTRDGSQLVEREISDYAAFSNQAGETIEVARAEAVRELARRIVAELEPWNTTPP